MNKNLNTIDLFGDINLEVIPSGVCAPKGFQASGVCCGIRKNGTKDLALIVSGVQCDVAAVYTTNRVKAAPLYVTMEHLKDGKAKGVIVNSGNANACAPMGEENARSMCRSAASALGIEEKDLAVASTGIIGVTLPIEKIEGKISELVENLSFDGSKDTALAIMTTDTFPKEFAVEFSLGGKTVRLGGIAKGSGMIHPNMGTMLAFLTTDAAIDTRLLQEALHFCVKRSFNRVSVDGDTSTNDMAIVFANGLAGNTPIVAKGDDYDTFVSALQTVCVYLAKELARDGEGATRLITCRVMGAESEEQAELMAKSVASSSLVKAAMFGRDANWGRVLCALGYSGADFDPMTCDVGFVSDNCSLQVCRKGEGLVFDEELATKILSAQEVEIQVNVNSGKGSASAWGCDLTYDYVKINGDYRT